MNTVDFYFDFGSPNSYLAHMAAKDVAKRTGATFNYVPVLLGGVFKLTGNQSPAFTYANIKGKLAYEFLEIERFAKKHRLTKFKMNPHFPINTLTLMRAAIAADAEGRLDEYIEACFAHMWESEKKMDDPEIFIEAMSASGLDGGGLLEATQQPDIKTKLIANTDKAVERGVFGVPTFFVGDEMYFGKDRLGQVEEALTDA